MLLIASLLFVPANAAVWPGASDPAPWSATEAGVEVQDLEVGDGEAVELGAELQVHYTGMLEDGTVFDTSHGKGQTFGFRVGDRQVIRGWEDGLIGMRVGGRRRLVIPADLAYGDRTAGPIPPNSTLYFEVELLALKPPRKPPAAPSEIAPDALEPVKNADGVRYADLAVGNGRRVRPGRRVCIDWASWQDGASVEHTYLRKGCTWYRLNDSDAPSALDHALVRMRVGGRRQVVGPGDPPVIYEVVLHGTGK